MRTTPMLLTLTLALVMAFPIGLGSVAPQGAVLNGGFDLVDDPSYDTKCFVFGDGYVNVFEPGSGLPWLVATRPCSHKATAWSNSAATDFIAQEGLDRAARVTPGATDPVVGANHNLWQTYNNPHQAYTTDFEALRFDIEEGDFPTGALVQISLSNTPLNETSPWVGIFIDCSLTFRNTAFTQDGVTFSADPVDASFASRWEGCDSTEAAWDAADEDGKRDILGKLRIVQLSFWAFNTGSAPVVIDNVELAGAKTVVESAAGL